MNTNALDPELLRKLDAYWRAANCLSVLQIYLYDNPQALLAIDMFCNGVRQQIGSFAVVLGGLDRLIFTAGIGERAASIRGGICHGLRHLGIALDEAANVANASRISTAQSACVVEVVPTNEEPMIARHSAAFSTA